MEFEIFVNLYYYPIFLLQTSISKMTGGTPVLLFTIHHSSTCQPSNFTTLKLSTACPTIRCSLFTTRLCHNWVGEALASRILVRLKSNLPYIVMLTKIIRAMTQPLSLAPDKSCKEIYYISEIPIEIIIKCKAHQCKNQNKPDVLRKLTYFKINRFSDNTFNYKQ